uniref:Myb-binding protein 1A n=1 Tax=Tetradesmus obliquus TaxID=3088 RepID=A0A383W0H0_TETOB|eukprot:jgi/Sobl393_1/15202/SZX70649.1
MSSSEDSEPIEDSSSEEEQEEQHGGDQQLTGATADPQVLQYFWDLASLEQDARQAAASSLVQALFDSQKQHESSHMPAGAQPGGSLDIQQEGGNRQQRMEQCLNCCSPLMAYGLKRLARGLASSRQGARQGFAAALAATLAHSAAAAAAGHKGGAKGAAGVAMPLQLPFVSAAGVLALLDACLEVTGSMKGSDQRDALLGRVFGLAALCRSGLPAALPAAPAGSISALRGTAVVAEQLLGLLQRKAFLRESAAAALVELLGQLSTADMQQVLSQAPKLTSLLQVQPNSATPESLYIALRLWHNLPQQQLQSCQLLPKLPASVSPPPELFWHQPGAVQRSSVAAAAAALFAAGQLKALCPALLATTASHPRMHPVWGCMLALLVPGFVPVKVLQQQPDTEQDQQQQQHIRAAPDQQQLANLWHHFVEASCLNSSHERKALALQLLQLLLPVLTPDAVPVLLSRQLLGCISTALRNKDSYLHASARKSMDRIRSCAEHSLIAKSNPALAAKLRLALAAQLQSANLQQAAAAAGGSKAKGQQGLLQGLDAPGVAAYVDQLLQEIVAALAQHKAAANGSAAAAAAESLEDEDMAEADAEADDTKAKQLLDQLAAALKLQAADAATLRKGLVFLAAAAFLQLPRSLDVASLAAPGSAAAAAAAAAATPAGKPSKKKQKAGKAAGDAAAAAAADGDSLQLEREVLQLAARVQPQPQQQVRQHCAARLITLLHSLHHRTGQQPKQQQQQQQQDGKEQQQQHGPSGETKKQRKARLQAEQEQAAAAARQAAWQQQEALTSQLVSAAQQLQGVQPTAEEDVLEMVQQLQALEVLVQQHVQQQKQQQQQVAATRCRVVLQLLHQLQLQLLSGGLTAEAAGSVVDDLELAVVRGLGLPSDNLGLDKSAAAAALRGSSSEAEEDEEQQGSDNSSSSSEDGEGEPAWQDVLLDLLLALLSNSSSSDAAKGGGVLVPSAPLREACEAVFRAFAEEMTPQGLSDMLRLLGQRASEAIKKDDEEDSEVEMDEDDIDDGGSDASASSDATGSGSEEDAEQQEEASKDADEAAPAAKKQPAAAAADGEDEDESDGGMDDEAMMRLDAQLGAAVRSMVAGRGGSAKERAASLLGLQLRVAALLEEWLKKCSKSPLVLQAVLPLLRALVSASGAGGNPTLADRLASIASKQLSKCRPVLLLAGQEAPPPQQQQQQQPPKMELAVFAADLRKVLYYASREKDGRVAAAAGQALLVLIGAGSEAGGAAAAAAQGAAADALQDFFDKKKSRLQKGWCEQLLSRCPEAVLGGEAAGLAAILAACSKGRNESTRGKAAALLPVLLRASQGAAQGAAGSADANPSLLLGTLQQHQPALAAALGAAVAGPYKGKEQHAAAVKAVVALLAGVGKLGAGKRMAELLGAEAVRELGKVVVVVKAAGVQPRVESQLDRLVDVAGLQQLVAAGKPDPARLALLNKQRAALVGKPAAAAAAAAGSKRLQQAAAGSKRPQQAAAAAAAADGESSGDEDEAGAREVQPKKKQKSKQQQQQQGGGKKEHKKEKKPAAAAAAAAAAATGKRKEQDDSESKGKKKKKHKQQQ